MRRVLFVDDERSVLDGLSRMLRSARQEWTMEFAASGLEALDRLGQAHFDVVVTDMRMPGMDGAELLGHVRDRHPHAVRMVLSGQADREAMLRAASVTHRYLSKPCDPEQLKAAVTRACALKDLLTNQDLQDVVSSLTVVPSLPSTYSNVMRVLQSPDSSIVKVGQTIGQDPSMTCKILQIVNSAFFGACHTVSSPEQAAVLLGTDLIKALALSAKIFSQFDKLVVHQFSIDRIWNHSIQIGAMARRIAQAAKVDKETVEQSLTAGLLHDIGKLVLAAHQPDEYGRALAISQRDELPFAEAERKVLNATHAEVGAYLLGLWGLPEPVVEAVAWHHRPNECPVDQFSPLTAVHVANALVHKLETRVGMGGDSQLDAAYLERLGLTDRIPEWDNLIRSNGRESQS
ncbi:MAG TPA: response regulator [Planctomycetaceae bacterium]|jgi:putative nucleotidyltransferase with HDIG domain